MWLRWRIKSTWSHYLWSFRIRVSGGLKALVAFQSNTTRSWSVVCLFYSVNYLCILNSCSILATKMSEYSMVACSNGRATLQFSLQADRILRLTIQTLYKAYMMLEFQIFVQQLIEIPLVSVKCTSWKKIKNFWPHASN